MPNKPLKKNKQAALVTGAGKRLGRAVALFLAAKGYDIALHYNSSKAEAMDTAETIRCLGVRCELFSADLADQREVQILFPQVIEAFPSLSVLVNSASIFIPNKFGSDNLGLFNAHWDINFKAPYILSCAFAAKVKKGQIINFIDTNVAQYTSKHEDYLMTKKALGEFTKMSAASWGPNIRVNGVSPGMILKPIDSSKDNRQERAQKIPLKMVGHPDYILKAIDALMENPYITGQIIAVDGGEQLV